MLITFAWSHYMAMQTVGLFSAPLNIFILTIIFGLVIFVVNVLMGVATIKAVADPAGSTIKGVYSDAKKYFWSYVWLAILLGATITIGILLFIIPGIIFAVWFAFSYFALLFEGKRGIEAMKTSKSYLEGNWWAVFGRYVFLILVGIPVLIIIGIVTIPVEAVFGKTFASIIPLLANIVIIPVAIGYSYLMYQELKANNDAQSVPVSGEEV